MEGLIPLVYRTLKKNKTRRQYECLSSGAAQSCNIAEFYVNDHGESQSQSQSPSYSHVYMKPSSATEKHNNTERNGRHHRRYMSLGDFPMVDAMKTGTSPTPTEPKLMRFRSHRMFSCVTGA